MKLKFFQLYENSSDVFVFEYCQIMVKVTVGLQNFHYLPQYKMSGPITQVWHKLGSLY